MTEKNITEQTKALTSEEYLLEFFRLVKHWEGLQFNKKKRCLNNTEMRLITEVIAAKNENKRLISTHLASRLGVTRSAISQIVGKLEKQGVIIRVPDAVDRKIAYIELSEKAMKIYADEWLTACADFEKIIAVYGTEKLNMLIDLTSEFISAVEDTKE